jgi:hypothetical protein
MSVFGISLNACCSNNKVWEIVVEPLELLPFQCFIYFIHISFCLLFFDSYLSFCFKYNYVDLLYLLSCIRKLGGKTSFSDFHSICRYLSIILFSSHSSIFDLSLSVFSFLILCLFSSLPNFFKCLIYVLSWVFH